MGFVGPLQLPESSGRWLQLLPTRQCLASKPNLDSTRSLLWDSTVRVFDVGFAIHDARLQIDPHVGAQE